jgi:hypothetical protein
MAHIPYGYRTEQGKAVVVEDQAAQIRKIYEGYLSGLGLTVAAAEAGLKMTHSEVKRILANRYYIGDDYYPAIIDQETYDKAQDERVRRAEKLGRLDRAKEPEEKPVPTRFRMGRIKESFSDPFEQAAYVYSLIERKG